MANPRRKRRRRDRRLPEGQRKGLALQARDVDVVEAVYRHRVLTQAQIAALFFPARTAASSRAAAQRRLERLYDHGYLERKFLPVLYGQGRGPTLYILDRKGAELLRLERGYDELSWHHSRKQIKTDFLEHTLATNDFLVAVRLACRRQGYQFTDWLSESDFKADYDRVRVRKDGRVQQAPVVPDGAFAVIAHERRYPFLLEVDRGTMTLARFQDKVRAYLAYHRGGGYERRFGTRTVRVLTVVASASSGEKRLANLKDATEAVTRVGWFWFGALPELTPATVLSAPVWQQGGEPGGQPLIQLS